MANEISNTDFPLQQNAYASFDAQSLKSLMLDQLNRGGVFTDQVFEGSNFNSFLDVIAYSYHVLMFYLNKTSSESLFSQSQIYENMNRIVKLIDYKPIGYQTSLMSFNVTASENLPIGTYTIPRYSYFIVNGIQYSFKEDVTFTKTQTAGTSLEQLSKNNLLYQGTFVEYSLYTAIGESYELVRVVLIDQDGNPPFIDHFSLNVYVRDKITQKWSLWNQVPNLFLTENQETVYELRFNENARYEIKFGNDVTGKKLNLGDEVLVYYLKSDGTLGETGVNTLDGNGLFSYSSPNYSIVTSDTKNTNISYMTPTQFSFLTFTNTDPSTQFGEPETVDNIRQNAPNTFKRQYRLITTQDFKSYITNTFKNIIHDTQVVNNKEYLNGHIKYLYNLGLKYPSLESRVLYNQITFADTCNFNNVYVYLVPKLQKTNSVKVNNNFVTDAQKQYIESFVDPIKLTSSEVIYSDPVYMAFNLGISFPVETLDKDIYTQTKLIVVKQFDSRINDDEIKSVINKIFLNYFNPNNTTLYQTIDITKLNNSISDVTGVKSFYTKRITDTGRTTETDGISLLYWNSVYDKEDIHTSTQNINMEYFQFPYLHDRDNFLERIEVVVETV